MKSVFGVVLKPGSAALSTFETTHRVLKELVPDACFLLGPARDGLPATLADCESVNAAEFERRVDLVLVLGGDGTFIHAASLLRDRIVPILGVNFGFLGVLTEVRPDEVSEVLPLALADQLPYSDRLRLDVEVVRGSKVILARRILNDAVLSPKAMARIATYRVMMGDELVTEMRGDGIIVATPTGSTAYSMAAGGSILLPQLEAVAITPICPHQLAARPLIVSPGELEVTLGSEGPVFATLDGRAGCTFESGDKLRIRPAPVPSRILAVPWRSHFQALRAKLRWGEG